MEKGRGGWGGGERPAEKLRIRRRTRREAGIPQKQEEGHLSVLPQEDKKKEDQDMTAGPSNVEVCGDFDEGKFCSVVGTKPTGEVMGQRGVEWQSKRADNFQTATSSLCFTRFTSSQYVSLFFKMNWSLGLYIYSFLLLFLTYFSLNLSIAFRCLPWVYFAVYFLSF